MCVSTVCTVCAVWCLWMRVCVYVCVCRVCVCAVCCVHEPASERRRTLQKVSNFLFCFRLDAIVAMITE